MILTCARAVPLPHPRDRGSSNVPADGPLILAPNHFSNMDHFFAGVYTRRRIRFMAKSQLFARIAILDYIFEYGGVFPVRRGHHDEEAFITAQRDPRPRRLRADVRRGRALAHRRARRAEAGRRPAGARDRACRWSRWRSTARRACARWKRLSFPKVTVQYGEPITFHGSPSTDARAAARGGAGDLRPGQGDVRRARGAGPRAA